MAGERTTWRAKPCGWRDRERVVALGDEFGSAGPLVLDVLEEFAKEQRDGDRVRTGLRALARAAFLPRGTEGIEQAREILRFAGRVGALDELAIGEDDAMTVTCRVSGFAADQGRGLESVRKAQKRAAGTDGVPGCPDLSHRNGTTDDLVPSQSDNEAPCPIAADGVPGCPTTEQNRTGQKELPRGARELSPAPKFNRKPIPEARLEVAEQLLADFNDRFGVEIRGWTSDGKLTEDLRVIVGALTADDRIDRDVGARMHEIVDRGDHYWSGRAHPGLVYGEKVRGRVAEAALAAPSETSERDRRHRKWELQRIASDLGSGVITDEEAAQKRADVDRRYPVGTLRPVA